MDTSSCIIEHTAPLTKIWAPLLTGLLRGGLHAQKLLQQLRYPALRFTWGTGYWRSNTPTHPPHPSWIIANGKHEHFSDRVLPFPRPNGHPPPWKRKDRSSLSVCGPDPAPWTETQNSLSVCLLNTTLASVKRSHYMVNMGALFAQTFHKFGQHMSNYVNRTPI